MTEKNFDEGYESLISRWPEKIDVRDKIFHKNGGVRIPSITNVHDQIERDLHKSKESANDFAIEWAIYTCIHIQAREVDEVYPMRIDKEAVRRVYMENQG